MRGRASLSVENGAASRGTRKMAPTTMSPMTAKNVLSTANPRDLRGITYERSRTGAESRVASAKPPTAMMRAEGTRHATNISVAKTTKTATTISTLRTSLGTQMGVGHVLLLPIVEAPRPSSGFFSSDVVAFLFSEDATTNLLTLARALHYTAYSVERSSTSPRRTIFDSYSRMCVEGPRVVKRSLVPARVLRISPKNAGLGPLEPIYVPINVLGSSFSTGCGVLRRLHEWTLGLWGK